MPTLLHLDSSADLSDSVSRRLTGRFADGWRSLSADHVVVRRDLHTDPLPHLPTNALHWAKRLRAPGSVVDPDAEALQELLISEVAAADVVVLGAPMYNWSAPSTLKAWIDYIHVPGVTSPFDEQTRPFDGKPIVVVSSRGDTYEPGTRNDGADHEIPALRQAFGTALGMEVIVVVADLTLASTVPALAGLRDRAASSLSGAERTIDDLVNSLGGSVAGETDGML